MGCVDVDSLLTNVVMNDNIPPTPVDLALAGFKLGQIKFARALGVSVQCVSNWKRRGAIPEAQLAAVSAVSGVPVEQLAKVEADA